MPYFAPGSSQLAVAPPTPLPPTPAVADKLAELSTDEPLPETYHANRIRLLAQSPRKLFLYWEFAQDPFETLRKAFPWQAQGYTLVVKLIDEASGAETLHLASDTRSQWFDVQPGRDYRAEVGYYSQAKAFIRLLASKAINTPRAGVSHRTDTTPTFAVSADDFARVLDDAGYISDALEVSLEAADRATHDAVTRAIARTFGGHEPSLLNEDDFIEMRGLLAVLALGGSVNELEGVVSERLLQWLEEIVRERRDQIDAAHLLDVLNSVLGLRIDKAAISFLSEEAMRRAARVIGGSDVRLPLRPFHLWMPSMSPSLLERMNAVRQARK